MSKNLKRVAALVVVLSVCMSMFSIVTAQGYSATITGWNSGIDARYTWFAEGAVTDEQKESTRNAMADELVYQNEVLGFRMGTSDSDETTWAISTDWGNMIAAQIENRDASKTDNVGNPWGDVRKWGVVTAPFIDTAFSIKGQLAAKYDANGNRPALSNEFVVGDATYQVYYGEYKVKANGVEEITTETKWPGAINRLIEGTNNKFRYAVAKYNQDFKRAGTDGKGLTVGYPETWAIKTTDGSITYQRFINAGGNAYVATRSSSIDDGSLEGAYVINGSMVERFLALGNDISACFAITGAPVENESNGSQRFENGVLSSAGFKLSGREITAFTMPGEVAPAKIDNEEGTITAFVADGANITALNPSITTSDKATVSPSGAQNFTNPVEYTVTAECGDKKVYTITVVELNDTDILSFEIDGVSADIDNDAKTITAVVSGDYDLTRATATISTLGTGVTLNPASGSTMNLSSSWTNGVSIVATKGTLSSTYTISVRNKSKDNSLISYVIPDGQLKYQGKAGDVVAVMDDNNVRLTYEYGNAINQSACAVAQIAEYATISPDPSTKRNQNATVYTVTSENGESKRYTVRVSIDDTDKTFPAADVDLNVSFLIGRFGGSQSAKNKVIKAIQDEYNNQRSMGFDPGTPSGDIEGWDGFLNRQFFDNGYGGDVQIQGHNAVIMMDVPDGKAYSVKNTMLNLWQTQVTDEDGYTEWLFHRAGAPAVNEFTMNGRTYQQFAHTYAYYDSGSRAIMKHGIGSFSSKQIALLKTSAYYKNTTSSIDTGVTYSFRQAYERANIIGYNPGIADGGATSLLTYENGGGLQFKAIGQTDETFRKVVTKNSKGQETTTVENGTFDNFVLYQVFTGAGELNDTNRDASNKVAIIKGTNALGVDNGGGIALFDYGDAKIKTMYENLPGEKVDLDLGDGITVKYNRTLGTPSNYLVDEEGVKMVFTKNKIGQGDQLLDDEGNPVFETGANGEQIPVYEQIFEEELGYYLLPAGGTVQDIVWIEGGLYSNDGSIVDVEVAEDSSISIENGGIKIINSGEIYDYDIANNVPEDEARKFNMNAIYINYSKDAVVDINNIQFSKLELNDELATIISPEVIDGKYATVDCEIGGTIRVRAESESETVYTVYVYQDGQPIMMEGITEREWGFWDEEPLTYPYWDDELQLWIYDYEPNEAAGLIDEDGNPIWKVVYGYYIDDVMVEENWVTIAKIDEWDPLDPINGWNAYVQEHFR